ncbi:MAG: thiolase family protein [Deltaproteobacteria bacterium]|nr:thiolase family protein [Deltaproteobacteria bacterium]
MVTSVRTTLRPAYIVDAVRTPIGKAAGALSSVRADDLAVHVIEALVARQPACAERIDHVIFGAINQAGEDNRNVARMALLTAGLPHEIPGVTVNRLCGSGLEAIADAARMIAVGEADCVIAGGVESMTRAPYVMAKPARAFDRKPPEIFDTSLGWRFINPRLAERYEPISMGATAENVARKYSVSRSDQDAYAVESHRRAAAATDAGAFADEIVPVAVPRRKGEPLVVTRDECIRPDCSLDGLAKLRPVFRADGTVTAGNASPINDGAAAVLVVSGAVLEQCSAASLGRLIGSTAVGVDPATMGEGPIYAVRKLLERTNLRAPMLDLVELNEAFAAQALACIRALELPPDRVNVNGGAIALGHPIGCSGARIMVTLVHEMKQREARLGLASLCIGVGQGVATLVERG